MKAVAVIVGMVLTITLYVGMILCGSYFSPSEHSQSHDVPDNVPLFFAGIIFLPPVLLFLASIATGFIIEPEMEQEAYWALLFYSPGLYFLIIAGMLGAASIFADSVFTFFAGNHSGQAVTGIWGWGCCILPSIALLWLAAFWAGVVLGYKIRSKVRGDD